MSSRCRPARLAAILALAALLGGCDREERKLPPPPAAAATPASAATVPGGDLVATDLFAGDPAPPPPDPRARDYQDNAFQLSEGKRLFTWMNCNGCHGNGGGGIGPSFMDDRWRYGGDFAQVSASIVQGRPNGMPSFRAKLAPEQVWQLAAYVLSIAGETSKAAASGRDDHMSQRPAESSLPRENP